MDTIPRQPRRSPRGKGLRMLR